MVDWLFFFLIFTILLKSDKLHYIVNYKFETNQIFLNQNLTRLASLAH